MGGVRLELSPHVRVLLIAYVGAIMVAAGVTFLFGLGWGMIALGVLTIAEAVVLVDVDRLSSRPAPPPLGR